MPDAPGSVASGDAAVNLRFSKHAHLRMQSRNVDPGLVTKALTDGIVVSETTGSITFKRNRLFVVMSRDMSTVVTVYKQRRCTVKRDRRERKKQNRRLKKLMGGKWS